MALFVRTFQPRFAPLVESGAKRQTIRKRPQRMPKGGDTISAREWTGKPYRSKQRELVLAPIVEVSPVRIYSNTLLIGNLDFTKRGALDAFARADGFDDWDQLVDWFMLTHRTTVFDGILIRWEPDL